MNTWSSIAKYFFLIGSIYSASTIAVSSVEQASFYNIPQQSASVWDRLREQINAGKPVGLADLPGLADIPMPAPVKTFLNTIQLYAPWPEGYEFGIALKGKVDIAGAVVNTMLFFSYDGNISFFVIIPPLFKFASISSELQFFDDLFKQTRIFVLSSSDYTFNQLDVTIGTGLNMLSTITLGYPFDRIGSYLGTQLNELEVAGNITKSLAGSLLTARLPGQFDFGPIKTTGLTFGLSIEEVQPTVLEPRMSIISGFKVTWPALFREPQIFDGALKISPTRGEVWGKTTGNLSIPSLPGALVNIRELGLSASVDWAQLAATAGTIPLSGLGFRTLVDINQDDPLHKKTFSGAIKVEYTTAGGLGDFILSAAMQGQMSLEEIVDFGARQIKETSRVVGQQIDLMPLYKNKGIIPTVIVENPALEIIPKTVELAGTMYSSKLAFAGAFALLNTTGFADFHISWEQGIRGQGYLSNVEIGPLKITGYLPEEKGPRLDFVLNLSDQHFYLSGRLQLDILGGISSESLIALNKNGLISKSKTKLFNKFDAELELKASLLQSIHEDNFYIICRLEQSALTDLAAEIKKSASALAPGFNRDAQLELDRVEDNIRWLNEQIEFWKQEEARFYQACIDAWNVKPIGTATCQLDDKVVAARAKIAEFGIRLGAEHTYKEAILKPGVKLVQEVLHAGSSLADVAAHILAKGFNIESLVFEGRLNEFVQEAKLPKVSMRVHVFGKTIDIQNFQLNLRDPGASIQQLLLMLRDKIVA